MQPADVSPPDGFPEAAAPPPFPFWFPEVPALWRSWSSTPFSRFEEVCSLTICNCIRGCSFNGSMRSRSGHRRGFMYLSYRAVFVDLVSGLGIEFLIWFRSSSPKVHRGYRGHRRVHDSVGPYLHMCRRCRHTDWVPVCINAIPRWPALHVLASLRSCVGHVQQTGVILRVRVHIAS